MKEDDDAIDLEIQEDEDDVKIEFSEEDRFDLAEKGFIYPEWAKSTVWKIKDNKVFYHTEVNEDFPDLNEDGDVYLNPDLYHYQETWDLYSERKKTMPIGYFECKDQILRAGELTKYHIALGQIFKYIKDKFLETFKRYELIQEFDENTYLFCIYRFTLDKDDFDHLDPALTGLFDRDKKLYLNLYKRFSIGDTIDRIGVVISDDKDVEVAETVAKDLVTFDSYNKLEYITHLYIIKNSNKMAVKLRYRTDPFEFLKLV